MQEQQTAKLKIISRIHNDAKIDYETIKKQAIEYSPVVGSSPLSAFELGRNKTLKMNGKIIPVTEGAYFAFLKKVLKVDPKFIQRFKKVTDEKTEIALLSTLKSGMAQQKGTMVNILANPFSKSVTNFSSGKHSFRTNQQLLTMFETVMNKYSSLELKDFYMNEDGTMNLSARSSQDMTINGHKNEAFLGGLTWENSYERGSSISHNAFRQICENGMFGFSDLPLFVGNDEQSLIKFFYELDLLNENNWIGTNFFAKVGNAMETNASFNELNFAASVMVNNSELTMDDLRHYLPEFNLAKNFLLSKGVDVATLDEKKFKNCPTNIKIWDLVNQITDYGSHDYGFNQDFSKIQRAGGKLLSKEYDTSNLVVFK